MSNDKEKIFEATDYIEGSISVFKDFYKDSSVPAYHYSAYIMGFSYYISRYVIDEFYNILKFKNKSDGNMVEKIASTEERICSYIIEITNELKAVHSEDFDKDKYTKNNS